MSINRGNFHRHNFSLKVSSYVVGIYSFKLSLLLSYMRFLPGNYRIATMVIAGIITAAHIAFLCVFLFLCTPVWTSQVPSRFPVSNLDSRLRSNGTQRSHLRKATAPKVSHSTSASPPSPSSSMSWCKYMLSHMVSALQLTRTQSRPSLPGSSAFQDSAKKEDCSASPLWSRSLRHHHPNHPHSNDPEPLQLSRLLEAHLMVHHRDQHRYHHRYRPNTRAACQVFRREDPKRHLIRLP